MVRDDGLEVNCLTSNIRLTNYTTHSPHHHTDTWCCDVQHYQLALHTFGAADYVIVTPQDCTRGKVIGSVVVVIVVVVVNTNFGISQHQGTCAACKRHVGVASGVKLAQAPSNQFNTTGVCSIC